MARHDDRDDSPTAGLTRRRFLEMVGIAGGTMAVHETMVALGWAGRAQAFQGVPDVPQGNGQRVLVLGAGVGGLTTAYELSQKGYRVTVLEAADRSGGRSYTVRTGDQMVESLPGCEETVQTCQFPTGPQMYLNSGPGRLPYHHEIVLDYCRRLGVDLEVYVMETRANFFQSRDHFGGKSIPNRRIVNDTRGYLSEMLAKAVNGNVFDSELSQAQKNELLDLLRVFGVLDPSYQYTDPARSGFVKQPGVHPGVPVEKLPFDELLASEFWEHKVYQSEDYEWQATLFQPVGGMDHVWRALEANLPEPVLLNHPVVSIDNGPDSVSVTTEDPVTGETRTHTADFCVSNIPLPHLTRIIAGNDSFSDDFRRAAASVTFADTCKVGWMSNRRFWELDDQIYGGISYIDDTITQMWYPSNGYFGERGVLTGCYNYDDTARRFGRLDLQTRLDVAYDGAQRLHPGFAQWVPKELGLSVAWQNVPHIGGGWADWQAHQVEPYRRLLRPDGRFWVVGDQVSHLPGWQEGAMASAHHVIRQLGEVAAGRVLPEALMDAIERLEEAPETDRLIHGFRVIDEE